MNKDVFGISCKDYLETKDSNLEIIVNSDIAEPDVIPVSYLFRDFKSMPILEQKALGMSNGKILDVGACTGSHSLYLQESGKSIISIDNSKGCCDVMKMRGLVNVINDDIINYSAEKFDTILLLMNGIGIAQSLYKLNGFLKHLKSLLKSGGKIIFDSSDLQYLYLDDDGSLNIPLLDRYYGELVYQLEYKNNYSDKFSWLFIDPFTMESIAEECGLKMEFISQGEHYDYLAYLY